MARCKYCGRTIRKDKEMCPWCVAWLTERGAWQQKLPPESAWDSATNWSPPEAECTMCGKEGATERSDGAFYCTECWYIWNH